MAKTARLELRLTPDEKDAIERAAKGRHMTVSEWVLDAVRGEEDFRPDVELVAAVKKIVADSTGATPSYARPLSRGGDTTGFEREAKEPVRAHPAPAERPKVCPSHPTAGKMKQGGKTFCDAPLCKFEYR